MPSSKIGTSQERITFDSTKLCNGIFDDIACTFACCGWRGVKPEIREGVPENDKTFFSGTLGFTSRYLDRYVVRIFFSFFLLLNYLKIYIYKILISNLSWHNWYCKGFCKDCLFLDAGHAHILLPKQVQLLFKVYMLDKSHSDIFTNKLSRLQTSPIKIEHFSRVMTYSSSMSLSNIKFTNKKQPGLLELRERHQL